MWRLHPTTGRSKGWEKLLASALIGVAGAGAAAAQCYPARAIRLIVPFPPGGPNDIFGRILGQKIAQQVGQQIVIDNRGGAAGIIGSELAAKAAPDGYTLLIGANGPIAINPNVYLKLPYDPVRDFSPVTLIATTPSLHVVHPSLPARSVKELIALAKAHPDQLNYASGGVGNPPHLAAELFKTMAGVNMVHVPYKGAGPALTDVLAGQVQVFFAGVTATLPLVQQRKLRAIAVTSIKRTAVMPEMPTISESGLPGYDLRNWYTMLAPAGTPREIVAKLNAEIVRALAAPDVNSRLLELGVDAVGSSPEEAAAYISAEIVKYAKLIKAAGIRPE